MHDVVMEIPTDFAHRDGLIGSIGQAICKTVEFVPDVRVFRASRPSANSAAHKKRALRLKGSRHMFKDFKRLYTEFFFADFAQN